MTDKVHIEISSSWTPSCDHTNAVSVSVWSVSDSPRRRRLDVALVTRDYLSGDDATTLLSQSRTRLAVAAALFFDSTNRHATWAPDRTPSLSLDSARR